MKPIGSEPCPVAMAKQRARAAMAFGTVAFVAVGALAWIGLDAFRAPANSTITSVNVPTVELAALSDSTTVGAQKTPASRAERERAAARKAILKNAGSNLELLDLNEVEQLTNATLERDPKREAARRAILRNAGSNLELLNLREVEELTGYASRTTQPVSAPTELAAAIQNQTAPDFDQSLEAIKDLAAEGGHQSGATAEETIVVSEPVLTAASTDTASTQVASAGTDCIAGLREFAGQQTILFASGSAELKSNDLPILRKFGRMAEACDGAVVHVTGHSDSSGSDVINLALSWQRADNTIATLAALGVDTSKFEPVGFGARSPSSQGDSSDEEINRRVEFIVFEEVSRSQ